MPNASERLVVRGLGLARPDLRAGDMHAELVARAPQCRRDVAEVLHLQLRDHRLVPRRVRLSAQLVLRAERRCKLRLRRLETLGEEADAAVERGELARDHRRVHAGEQLVSAQ